MMLYEYKNDFLYFTFQPYESDVNGTLLYCSGVDVEKFYPITKGRHRPMANPAIRGLQLVNLGVRSLALRTGAKPLTIQSDVCRDVVPRKNGWYRENLLIENAPDTFPADAAAYSVVELMKKINKAIVLGEKMPDEALSPDKLQSFLISLCEKYGA